MFLIGIDENGLGPRLGPLVVTAIALQAPSYKKREYRELGKSLGVYDSKATSGFGRMAAAEGIALALLERLCKRRPTDADELLDLIVDKGLATLRAGCPSSSAPQCWSATPALPAFGGDAARGHATLDALERAGIRIVWARSAPLCAERLNREVSRLGTKLLVDLSLFEELLLQARAALPAQIEAFCGKVGGISKYPRFFRHLTGYAIESEEQIKSVYRVAGLGRVTFEVDADGNHLPVGLASMLGKYLREIAMERQNLFYLRNDPSLRRVSGYRDRLTADFVEKSAPLRRRLGISQACFEREK